MKNGGRQRLNRTGATVSPELTADLIEGTRRTTPSAEGDGREIARVRVEYAKEAESVGSIPMPATISGAVKSMAKALTGKKALVLVDKLGERLAFERSGTRLYDALISKFDAYGSWSGGPSRRDLMQIRTEEHAHFTLIKQSIEGLGGDPTAVTPSADLHAVASKGLCSVLTDPRTNLRDGMEAILVAELVDNDCWENLVDLSRALGHEELAVAFTEALGEEREHLRRVRLWLGASLSGEATGKLADSFAARADERDRRQVVSTDGDPKPQRRPNRPSRRQSGKASAAPARNGRRGQRKNAAKASQVGSRQRNARNRRA
jgi:hypothetical protein